MLFCKWYSSEVLLYEISSWVQFLLIVINIHLILFEWYFRDSYFVSDYQL